MGQQKTWPKYWHTCLFRQRQELLSLGRMSTHDVVVVAYDGSELRRHRLGDDGLRSGEPARRRVRRTGWCWPTSAAGDILCDSGLRLRADARLSAVEHADTVVVSGGLGHTAATEDKALIRHLRRLAHRARRISSVCTGATLLAEAGHAERAKGDDSLGVRRRSCRRTLPGSARRRLAHLRTRRVGLPPLEGSRHPST